MRKVRLPKRPIEKGPMAAKGTRPLGPSIALDLRSGRLHRDRSWPVVAIRHHDPAYRLTIGVPLLWG